MKKIILSLTAFAFLFIACSEDSSSPQDDQLNIDMSDFYLYTDADVNQSGRSLIGTGDDTQKSCYTMANLNRLLNQDPELEQKMYDIEYNTRKFIAENNFRPGNGNGGGNGGGGDDGGGTGGEITPYQDFAGTNTIPVVFHIIYNRSSENIPDSQIQDQIDALNRDFNANNGTPIPAVFQNLEADLGVNFATAGVIRVKSRKKSWRPDDSMKFASSGGSDAVDPLHYLNVWVVNNMPYMGGNILGYAQFPGGNRATDGIVLDHRFTGNTQYSTGQTATHEIGHWMNLRHIWGDGPCSADDFVADTPLADGSNTGCPSFPGPNGCGEDEMFMNYMDYTNDTCMSLFTNGQKARMAAQFQNGAYRSDMGITIN